MVLSFGPFNQSIEPVILIDRAAGAHDFRKSSGAGFLGNGEVLLDQILTYSSGVVSPGVSLSGLVCRACSARACGFR